MRLLARTDKIMHKGCGFFCEFNKKRVFVSVKKSFLSIDSYLKTGIYTFLSTVNFLLQQKILSVNNMLINFCYKQFC